MLEAAWKDGPDDERPLWQGLAQLMVGITHVQRGNVDGARALLRRATARLTTAPVRYGVDVAGLVDYAETLEADLEAGGEVPADRLRPQLTS